MCVYCWGGGWNFSAFCVDDVNVVSYSSRVKGRDWKSDVRTLEQAGLIDANLEAVKMELNGDLNNSHNIFYRVYLQNYGWLCWARNGEVAGGIDANLNIQQVQVKIERNDIVPQLEGSQLMATQVVDISSQSIQPSNGYRSNVKKIGVGNSAKFFKCPEYNVKSGVNKELWLDILNIKENVDTKIRNVAASRLERLLGLSDVVAKAEYAIIRRRGEADVQGALIDNVKNGIDYFPFAAMGNKTISPSLQRSLTTLEVFDGLIGQADRGIWNYSVLPSQNTKRAVKVVGYDNDCTFGNISNLKFSYYCYPLLITSDDKMILPHMDKVFAERILKVSDNQIRATLFDTLEPEYINATISRLNQIKNAIKNTIKVNPRFLLNENEWSQKTIEDELNCQYDTYLKHFRQYI